MCSSIGSAIAVQISVIRTNGATGTGEASTTGHADFERALLLAAAISMMVITQITGVQLQGCKGSKV